MKLIEETSRIKNLVTKLLIEYPRLRNSDTKLMANIWRRDLIRLGQEPNQINAMTFLTFFAAGQLTNPETIRRVRQKIQEQNPELQGKVRGLRKQQAEEITKEIHDL
jgi:hypothetical protein